MEALTKEEIIYLYSLIETTNKGLLPKYYYFGEYCEQHICLNKANNEWLVYCCERGNKFDIKRFEDCKKACTEVIWECSCNKNEIEPAIQYFLTTFQKNILLSDEEINNFIAKYDLTIDKKENSKKRIKEVN